jgi:O-antigen/teichoic acid export membrane protein
MRARQVLQSLWASAGIQAALFGSGVLVARALGPSDRGELAIVQILPAVAAQVTCIGVPAAATYFIAKNRWVWRRLSRDLLSVSILQMLLSLALVAALDVFFLGSKGSDAHIAAAMAAASIPLMIGQFYALAVLQGLGDLRSFNIYRAAPVLLYTLGLLASIPFGITLISSTAIWLGSQVITVIGLCLVFLRRRRVADVAAPGSTPPERGEVVRFGAAGFLAQVSPVETFRVDQLAVAALFSSEVVGFYAVASSISNIPRFIADGIVAVAYPHVAEQSREAGRASSRRYMLVAVAMCGGSALAIGVLLPWLIPALFGAQFDDAVPLGILLLAGAALISIRRVGSDCLRALGKPGASTVIELITWVVIAVGFVTIGTHGAGRGIALSLAIAAAVGLALTFPLLRSPTEPAARAEVQA